VVPHPIDLSDLCFSDREICSRTIIPEVRPAAARAGSALPTKECAEMNEVNDVGLMYLAYALYLLLSVALTVWVARVLSSSGETFLVRCFGQDREMAQSTNRLLVIGFYLVNLGFICFRLSDWHLNEINLVPEIGSRVGVTLLVLGAMHFFNMTMIARMGRTVNRWIHEQDDGAADLRIRPDQH
jgi:hypothetical protein